MRHLNGNKKAMNTNLFMIFNLMGICAFWRTAYSNSHIKDTFNWEDTSIRTNYIDVNKMYISLMAYDIYRFIIYTLHTK